MLEFLKRRFKFLTIIFILLVIVFGGSIFLGSISKRGQDGISPTPVLSIIPSVIPTSPGGFGRIPTDMPPDSTGYGEEKLPEKEVRIMEQRYKLRLRTPVSQNEFLLSYDYDQLKFIVILKSPYDNNQTLFNKWLKDNGYGDIPQSEFVIKRG